MVEAGVNFNIVKQEINFDISKLKGVIYSHEHLDHSKAVRDILKYSIPVYSSKEAIEKVNVSSHSLFPITDHHSYSVGEFRIKAVPLRHDVKCLGVVIKHAEMGLAVFSTDT
mgnify:CR=1 FL=1